MKWLALAWLAALLAGLLAIGCDDDDDDSGGGGDDDASPDDDATDDDVSDDDAADDDMSDDDLDDDSDDDDDTTPNQGHAMVVFHDDDTVATDFAVWLLEVFHQVTTVEVDDILPGADFSDVDLFLVDATAGFNTWTQAQAETLTNTGKPIIGVADGAYVFEFLDQYLDRGATWGAGTPDVIPMELSHPLWTTPHDLGLTNSDPVDVLPSGGSTYGALFDDGTNPLGVEFLAQQSDSPTHYLIAAQHVKYALWGFGDGPSNYTNQGMEIFLNLVAYVQTAK
jgi:hypothetical protein